MVGKIFGIRGVSEKLKEEFQTLQDQKELTPADTLSFLLKTAKTPLTPVNTADFTEKIDALTAVNAALTDENAALTARLQVLTATVQGLTDESAALKDATNAIEGKLPTGTAFICSPPLDMAKQINRVISYLIHKKEMERTDKNTLLSAFAQKCITYTIKNEYQHVLK